MLVGGWILDYVLVPLSHCKPQLGLYRSPALQFERVSCHQGSTLQRSTFRAEGSFVCCESIALQLLAGFKYYSFNFTQTK